LYQSSLSNTAPRRKRPPALAIEQSVGSPLNPLEIAIDAVALVEADLVGHERRRDRPLAEGVVVVPPARSSVKKVDICSRGLVGDGVEGAQSTCAMRARRCLINVPPPRSPVPVEFPSVVGIRRATLLQLVH